MQIDYLLRVAQQSARIAGQERFAFADAENERAAEAGADDHVWMLRTDDGQTVGALEPGAGLAHGFDQVTVEVSSDQVGDDLGIGLAAEDEAFGLELLLEGDVVLDDAVMNDGNGSVAAEMRVGVSVGGAAVGGPARVANAVTTGGRLIGQQRGQLGNSACPLAEVQFRASQRGHAGAVVAAVFQAFQALQQNWLRLTAADVTNDSTHACISPGLSVSRVSDTFCFVRFFGQFMQPGFVPGRNTQRC